jgi:hypothetical protein
VQLGGQPNARHVLYAVLFDFCSGNMWHDIGLMVIPFPGLQQVV